MMRTALFIIFYLSTFSLSAQWGKTLLKNNQYQIGVGAFISSDTTLPFLLQTNQYGEIPYESQIFQFKTSVLHDYDSLYYKNEDLKKFNWGYGANLVANVGRVNQLVLSEAYIKARYGAFEIYGGRRKEIFGLVDTAMTSGSYIWSGNALPLPKLQISIPNYTPILQSGLLSIKGGFAHGWFENNSILGNFFLHQKWFYAQIGKPTSRLKFYSGFNHQVQWGGSTNGVNLNNFYSLFYSVLPLKYVSPKAAQKLSLGDLQNRVGNQLGTIDFAVQYANQEYALFVYRQNLYEQGAALLRLANIRDGLNGVTLTKTLTPFSSLRLNAEFFYSKNQGTRPLLFTEEIGWELENYFTHYLYQQGWSYKGRTIGTPLITTKNSTLSVFRESNDLINNNRISSFSSSLQLLLKHTSIWMQYFYSSNSGILINKTASNENYKQTGYSVSMIRNRRKVNFGFEISFQYGEIYDKSVGSAITLNYDL